VGVHEAGHEEKRSSRVWVAGPSPGVAVFDPGHRAVGDQGVAGQPGVGEQPAVGFRTDPAGKPVRTEWIGLEVPLHVLAEHLAVGGVGGKWRTVDVVEIGVADVPLAVVMGVVPAGSEPVAEGGDPARGKPAHP